MAARPWDPGDDSRHAPACPDGPCVWGAGSADTAVAPPGRPGDCGAWLPDWLLLGVEGFSFLASVVLGEPQGGAGRQSIWFRP